MEPPILRIMREISEECDGTKREPLGRLINAAIAELTAMNDTNSRRIDGIVHHRDTSFFEQVQEDDNDDAAAN